MLSLFPGIGLLDRAFEEEGFTVVRGPDLLWGGDIRRFHPPAGRFDGVIGGDPCQFHSALKRLNPRAGERYGDMTPEFARIVNEARPSWFLRENVPHAPDPHTPGYSVDAQTLNNRWLGEIQERTRKLWFGIRDAWSLDEPPRTRRLHIEYAALENIEYRQAVTSSSRAVPVALGPNGRVKRTYTDDGKRHGPNNGRRATLGEMCGVPLPMGRAIAKAVRRALSTPSDTGQ